VRIGKDIRQDCGGYDQRKVELGVKKLTDVYPHNRLVKHLAGNCALLIIARSKKLFLQRWECPVPVSPACNAAVWDVFLLPDEEPIVSTQDRLTFYRRLEIVNTRCLILSQLLSHHQFRPGL
jgi:hypothetical protein